MTTPVGIREPALRPFDALRGAPSKVEGQQAQGRPERSRGAGTGINVIGILLFGISTAFAQSPGSPIPDPGSRMAVDPIRCWRQSSTGAVTVGEQFTVVLTCAVFE